MVRRVKQTLKDKSCMIGIASILGGTILLFTDNHEAGIAAIATGLSQLSIIHNIRNK